MTLVVTYTPDQKSLFAQLGQGATDIDWNQVRPILRKHGRQAAKWKGPKNACALHYACWKNGPLDVIQMLVTLWPDAVKEKDKYSQLPLDYACRYHQSPGVIQLLVDQWTDAVKEKDGLFRSPLHYACQYNQSLEVIQLLVDKWSRAIIEKDSIGYLPLHVACQHHQSLEAIQFLVDKWPGAVKEKDNYGWLPLHWACRNNQSLEVIQLMVDKWPYGVKEKDVDGDLPLHLACQSNRSVEVIQWLAKKWPQSIQERNQYGKTPFDLSVQASDSWLEKVPKHDSTFPNASWSATPKRAAGDSSLPFAEATLVEESPNDAQVSQPSWSPDRSSDTRVDEPFADDRTNILRVIRELEAPTPVSSEYVESVQTKEKLGDGLFGSVFKGVDSRINVAYAIKQIKSEILMEGNEALILKAKETFATEQKVLSKYRHPNIAAMFAYSFATSSRGSYYLLYELGENGDLYSFLSTELGRSRLSFLRRVQIALDIAVALSFLHSRNKGLGVDSCCHRDIKSANIVLTGALGAKLIDVGLATFVKEAPSTQAATTGSKGTPGYIDPQYAMGAICPFAPACDVFSLGIVLVELWTGRHQNYLQENGRKVNFQNSYTGKKRRELSRDVDYFMGFEGSELPNHAKDFAELAIECMTERDPEELDQRPTAKVVLARLQKIYDNCETKATVAGRVLEREESLRSSTLCGDEICTRCSKDPVAKSGEICVRCLDFEAVRQELTKVSLVLAQFQVDVNAKLDSSLAGHALLNARLINPVPRCFVLVPREQKPFAQKPSSWINRLRHTKYWLFFVCEDSFIPVQAPIKLDIPKEGVQSIAPVLAISLSLLQFGIRAGTSIDLDLTSIGQFRSVHLATEHIGEMLHAAIAALKASKDSRELVGLLESGAKFDEHQVGQLYGQSYKLISEKAYEQNKWMLQMVQVQMPNSCLVKWVKKDVATKNSYTIVKH